MGLEWVVLQGGMGWVWFQGAVVSTGWWGWLWVRLEGGSGLWADDGYLGAKLGWLGWRDEVVDELAWKVGCGFAIGVGLCLLLCGGVCSCF